MCFHRNVLNRDDFLYYSFGTNQNKEGTGKLLMLKMIWELAGGGGGTEVWIQDKMTQDPCCYRPNGQTVRFSLMPNPEILNFRLKWDCPFQKAKKSRLHFSRACFITTTPLLVRGRKRTYHFKDSHNCMLLYPIAFSTYHIKTHLFSSEIIFVDRGAI